LGTHWDRCIYKYLPEKNLILEILGKKGQNEMGDKYENDGDEKSS